MAKVVNLGRAKPDSRMFKRGYTINFAPNAVNKAATEKPPAKPPKNPEK